MVTAQLKTILGLSIPVFIAHGIEEVLTGFYNLDAWDEWLFGRMSFSSTHEAMFVTFQAMLWLLLLVSFVLLLSERWRLRMLAVLGVLYVFELHHVLKALGTGGYYPGLITSLMFPVLAYFFWREWLRCHTHADPVA